MFRRERRTREAKRRRWRKPLMIALVLARVLVVPSCDGDWPWHSQPEGTSTAAAAAGGGLQQRPAE